VDVMDYSLLVGVDDESKELVLGIIDFMRQYTWDKHLETWVKASGILGGAKNASPTIISPKQYKKRFRKAMNTYFLTVPDQWSSRGFSLLFFIFNFNSRRHLFLNKREGGFKLQINEIGRSLYIIFCIFFLLNILYMGRNSPNERFITQKKFSTSVS
jgi:hypothetical protein